MRAWVRSGRSAQEYAARRRIHPATLSWWRWRLQQEGEDLERLPVRVEDFVELAPALEGAAVRALEARIELTVRGIAVQVPNGFDGVTLRRILDVVEGKA